MLERALGRSHHNSPARRGSQLTSRERLGSGGQQEAGGPVPGLNRSQGGRGALELLVFGGLGGKVAAQPIGRKACERSDRRAALEERFEETLATEAMSGDGADGGDGCRQLIPPWDFTHRAAAWNPERVGGPSWNGVLR